MSDTRCIAVRCYFARWQSACIAVQYLDFSLDINLAMSKNLVNKNLSEIELVGIEYFTERNALFPLNIAWYTIRLLYLLV